MASTIASVENRTANRRDHDVPLWRLNLLRAGFLLFAVLGFFVHPQWIVDPSLTNRGMVLGFTAGLWIMSFFGLRYPLQMLPIFLLEFVWKTLWLLRFGLPQWMAGRADPQFNEDLILIGCTPILFGLIIPWNYFWRHYIREPAERWR